MREITQLTDESFRVTLGFETSNEVLVVEEYDPPVRDVTMESDVKRFGFNGHSFFAVTDGEIEYTIHTTGEHTAEAEVNISSETNILRTHGPTTIGSQDETDPPIDAETTFTVDNIGTSAWEVTDIRSETVSASLGEENPELTLEVGERYVIKNNGWSRHPLEFQDATGEPLLSQGATGSFEDDSAVNWTDNGERLAFLLTEELGETLTSYICTNHSSMEGSIEVITDRHPSGVDQEVWEAVTAQSDPPDELGFQDLVDGIQAYQDDEPVNGVELGFQDLIDLIQWYQLQQ